MFTLLQLVLVVVGLVLFKQGKDELAKERRRNPQAEANGQMAAAGIIFFLVAVSALIQGAAMLR